VAIVRDYPHEIGVVSIEQVESHLNRPRPIPRRHSRDDEEEVKRDGPGEGVSTGSSWRHVGALARNMHGRPYHAVFDQSHPDYRVSLIDNQDRGSEDNDYLNIDIELGNI